MDPAVHPSTPPHTTTRRAHVPSARNTHTRRNTGRADLAIQTQTGRRTRGQPSRGAGTATGPVANSRQVWNEALAVAMRGRKRKRREAHTLSRSMAHTNRSMRFTTRVWRDSHLSLCALPGPLRRLALVVLQVAVGVAIALQPSTHQVCERPGRDGGARSPWSAIRPGA
eukprot:6004074-Prymnesium_polylepis.1